MKTDRKILELSPGAAARLIALTQLNDAHSAGERLDADLPEALPDFRDCVRRLRTTLAVYRNELRGSVRRRDRKALRDLMRRIRPQRDLVMQLELLNVLPETAATVAVRTHLTERLTAERSEASFDWKEFRRIERRLRGNLETFAQHLDPEDIPEHITFARVAAGAASRLSMDAMAALATIRSEMDLDSMRSALLSAKKLRYIIEPLRAASMTAVDGVVRLSRLQELLRAQHDHALLVNTIESIASQLSASEQAASDELAGIVRARATEMYSELRRLWLDANDKWFFQRLIAAFTTISQPAGVPRAPRPGFPVSGSLWRGPSSASTPSS